MNNVEWKYVPVVGLVAAFIGHWRACSRHRIDPSESNFEKTWEEGDKYFTALAVTLVAACLVGVTFAVFAS